MRLTKIEMARRIIACLDRMDALPATSDPRVLAKVKQSKDVLLDQMNMARAAFEAGSCVVNPDA